MLMPKRVKFRKQQRGRMKGKAQRGSNIAFGEYGLKAMEPAWITARQIEAARIAITRSSSAAAASGFVFFPTSRLRKNRRKHAWEKARAIRSIGSPW